MKGKRKTPHYYRCNDVKWIFKAETKKKKWKTERRSDLKNGEQKSVEKDHSSNSEDETKEEGLLFEEDYHELTL